MSESAPRLLYGIDSVTLYNTVSGLPYGSMRVLGGFSGTSSGDLNERYHKAEQREEEHQVAQSPHTHRLIDGATDQG